MIDFDFAAPGRPVYDLAQLAKMWVPIDAPADVARLRRPGLDVIARLRVVADAYGLPPGREDFVDAIDDALVVGDRFVARQVQRGVPAFVAMWKRLREGERFERAGAGGLTRIVSTCSTRLNEDAIRAPNPEIATPRGRYCLAGARSLCPAGSCSLRKLA